MKGASASPHLPAGFSLLELLVALVILSMLMMLLAGQLSFGARVWERVDGPGRAASHWAFVRSYLATSFEHIYPAMTKAQIETPAHVDFRGTSSEMEYLAPPPGAEGIAPFLRVGLALTSDGRKLHLVLSNDLIVDDPGQVVEERDLLEDIEGGKFSYYGALPQSAGKAWQEKWVDRVTLPELIRFRVAFAGQREGAERELIVRPRIDADVSCLYDRLTGGCRGR